MIKSSRCGLVNGEDLVRGGACPGVRYCVSASHEVRFGQLLLTITNYDGAG